MILWPSNVNNKAYGMKTGFVDNIVKINFESGRSRTWAKNSTIKKSFSFNIKMDDSGASSEYKLFLAWYTENLKGGSETFLLPDLITHEGNGITTGTEYKMTSTPQASGQKNKIVSLSVEEV